MKRNIYLRVKLKSLAAEARIIRAEEQRACKRQAYDLQGSLRFHRITRVRSAARETLLAYQYLRGIPYAVVEKLNSSTPNWKAVQSMVNRYGAQCISVTDLKAWAQGQASKLAA